MRTIGSRKISDTSDSDVYALHGNPLIVKLVWGFY